MSGVKVTGLDQVAHLNHKYSKSFEEVNKVGYILNVVLTKSPLFEGFEEEKKQK